MAGAVARSGINAKSSQMYEAQVDRTAAEGFLEHHRDSVRARMAQLEEMDVDRSFALGPEQEAVVMTFLMHFFLVGVYAGRYAERQGS